MAGHNAGGSGARPWGSGASGGLCTCGGTAGSAPTWTSSARGTTWTFSPTPAYSGTVQFRNGSSAVFARIERPVIVFNGSTPRYLINGVQRYDWDDKTFTLITEIRSAAKS